MGLFSNDKITKPVVQNYVDTKHGVQPYISLPKGFIQGSCTPNPNIWISNYQPGWNTDWTIKGYKKLNDSSDDSLCDEWVENPVLVVKIIIFDYIYRFY